MCIRDRSDDFCSGHYDPARGGNGDFQQGGEVFYGYRVMGRCDE